MTRVAMTNDDSVITVKDIFITKTALKHFVNSINTRLSNKELPYEFIIALNRFKVPAEILMKRALMINNNIVMTAEDIFITKTALRYFVDTINARLSDKELLDGYAKHLDQCRVAADKAYDKFAKLHGEADGIDNNVDNDELVTDGE